MLVNDIVSELDLLTI